MQFGQKLASMERLTQQPMEKSRKKCQKCLAGRKDFEGNEEITVQEQKNWWNRIRPRRWNTVLQESYRCDIEGCGKVNTFGARQRNFSSRWFMMGHTRAMCSGCWEKRAKALGKDTSLGTPRFVQVRYSISRWKNITLDVEGDVGSFACEFLYEMFRCDNQCSEQTLSFWLLALVVGR